jgi:metal-responsive CopG/Arc/MetJ family transcriptional regulator
MPTPGWKSVAISEKLYKKVIEIVSDKTLGYKSISDFVADAVRRRLEELGLITQGKVKEVLVK